MGSPLWDDRRLHCAHLLCICKHLKKTGNIKSPEKEYVPSASSTHGRTKTYGNHGNCLSGTTVLLAVSPMRGHKCLPPHLLSAWLFDTLLQNIRMLMHSFIHQRWLKKTCCTPVLGVGKILRQIKHHLCPQESLSFLTPQTSKRATIGKYDWS